ncbi:MAG: DUF5682 family protein [Lentisphaeraceae bacterium]|nr:DUF5682 family protein [Lentisphaeraceae bacterium]
MNAFADIEVIGVRHLSPAAANAVLGTLEKSKPKVVLIEGPADATDLLKYIVHEDVKLPISLLAYSQSSSRTLAYPLVDYSPEYVAIKWAFENDALVKFIDLPAKTFLALDEESVDLPVQHGQRHRLDVYKELALDAGESSYDSYWERNFEHQHSSETFREMSWGLGAALRKLEEGDTNFHHLENLTRESYMRRCIQDELDSGVSAASIALILGAYHAPVIDSQEHIMTNKELASLPIHQCAITLMPYSYFRLSRQSGYGAGNSSPLYFTHMWNSREDKTTGYTSRYISEASALLKKKSYKVSTAQLIDAGQLAASLASLKNGVVVLEDLRSAVQTCMMNNVPLSISEEIWDKLEIGSAVGFVPEGLVMTSIQDDFSRLLKELKLARYKTDQLTELKLDLRENRQVKTAKAAFRDLERSKFFNQLKFLKIPFADSREEDSSASWIEKWFVRWRPESEIALVENVLWGETIKAAVTAKFVYEIQQCNKLVMLSRLLRQALDCGFESIISHILNKLKNLAVSDADFLDLSHTCNELSYLVKYGSIRRVNTQACEPFLGQLFYEACLLLMESADCDEKRQGDIASGMHRLQKISNSVDSLVDVSRWQKSLQELSNATNRNPFLSGLAFALLLNQKVITDEDLAKQLQFRLSPALASDIAIYWFEGLISYNAADLVHNKFLWESMSLYVECLTDDEFKKALVLFRRTFSQFENDSKKTITDILINIWGLSKEEATEFMALELTEKESELLDELDDLDFDDF